MPGCEGFQRGAVALSKGSRAAVSSEKVAVWITCLDPLHHPLHQGQGPLLPPSRGGIGSAQLSAALCK